MRVKFWGTRGSLPTPSSRARGFSTAKYGGHTTCVHVRTAENLIIHLDAGSGAMPMGDALLAESGFGKTPLDILWLITHTHWDHIQGFPFFGPAFMGGNRLHFFGSARRDQDNLERSLENTLDHQQNFNNFPVTRTQMPAQMSFTGIAAEDALIIADFETVRIVKPGDARPPRPAAGAVVETTALYHPNGSLGYKITECSTGATFAFITDHEPRDDVDERLRSFLRGCDFVSMDGQYTEDEYAGVKPPARKGWGHSTPPRCLDLAADARVPVLLINHHEPRHDDAFLDRMWADAHDYRARQYPDRALDVLWAYDNMEVLLPGAGQPPEVLSRIDPAAG